MLVVCNECKEKLDKSNAVSDGYKYYHAQCYELKLQRKELCDYICRIMHLKAPGPVIYAQRKRYINEGMTDVGILSTLKYMYEVKHMKIDKAQERISLVPKYYNEAQDFWERKRQEETNALNAAAEKIKQNQQNITIVYQTQKQQPKTIDPMDWWKED